MTDTTDIKALRSESANLMILLHKEELGVDVTLTAAKFFDDVFRMLEAERQRAERAKSALDSMTRQRDEVERLRVVLCDDKENLIDKCIERDKEIAALKGDQVPVAFTAARWLDTRCKLSVWTDRESAVMEIGDNSKVAELYDRPQKPVVYPDTKRMDWLCAHCVEVRDPQMYGSHAMFHAQQDSEEWDLPHHTTLREQVDAAIEAAGGIVKDGE